MNVVCIFIVEIKNKLACNYFHNKLQKYNHFRQLKFNFTKKKEKNTN